ncbi:MAG: FAD-dependent oxidoreductase [Candidatus Xenobia bacterium]
MIAVIGGGVMGASIAYHLALKGARQVVLLERGTLCCGETAKSGGFIQTHWTSLAETRLIDFSRTIFQQWGERCGWVNSGYLHVTGPEKLDSVRAVHDMLLSDGKESHWLDQRGIKTLQPLMRVDDLVGAAYEPHSGWADPVATTRLLATLAREQGAELREGVTVLQIVHRHGKIMGVETDQGFLEAEKVVLAAGPWTPGLHPDPRVRLPVLARRGQVTYMTRPGGLPRRELACYDEITGLYTHCDGDTNLVGIDWDFDPVYHPDSYDRELDADYLAAALEALTHRFPSLRSSQLVRGVVGLYDFTPDGHPVVDGPLGIEGYYVAAGFSGAGFKSAPALGLGMAELVLEGRASSVDLDFLRLARFG